MLCSCPRDRLCDRCVDDGFAQLRGTAASRGERWAEDVAARVHGARAREPWPTSPKARRIAEAKVADLSPDPRLRARLAAELEAWAARRWEPRGGPSRG